MSLRRISGVNLEATRCILTASMSNGIQIIPTDNSSPEDIWTEYVVSFNERQTTSANEAVRQLGTKQLHYCQYYIFS